MITENKSGRSPLTGTAKAAMIGQRKRNGNKTTVKGFTLIELSVGILITGLIVGALAQLGSAKYKLYLLNEQTQTLATIHTAIASYVSTHGHLPCAARYDLPQTDPNFGVGAACTGSDATPPLRVGGTASRLTTATPPGPLSAPGAVRIGAVPVRDLGLANSYAVNPWGYRFTYAVTEALAQTATYNIANGAIDFVDDADVTVLPGGVAGTALYALVDPGIDGAGAYTGYDGKLHAPCPTGGGSG